jgi:hypothetical protein
MLAEIGELLKENFSDVITTPVRYLSAAADQCRAQLDDPFRLIIVNHSIAKDFRSPLIDAENLGINFLESLKNIGHAHVPTILTAPSVDSTLYAAVEALRTCHLLLQDCNFADRFAGAAKKALDENKADPEQEEPKQVKIVVSLNLEKQLWEYQLKGIGFTYFKPAVSLQMDSSEIKRFIERSRRAVKNPEWEPELLDVGKEFGRVLLYGNPDFLADLRVAEAIAGGAERKTICFSIEKSIHPAALEALTHPKDKDFWMLQVPMYRRLIPTVPTTQDRTALFSRKRLEAFNTLIIESPAEGAVERLTDKDGQPLYLDALKNVTEEADEVEEALLSLDLGKVERIGPGKIPADSTFKEHLQKRLTSGRWDLVHYAGHSYYNEATGNGYIFFPGRFVEELNIEVFNTFLAKAQTRFIYLSGCKSSEAGFVFEMARLQIPGVLGFRWPINDQTALEFAKVFYSNLFKKGSGPCLETAFLSTRCTIRERYKQDQIWAAATLILQDAD